MSSSNSRSLLDLAHEAATTGDDYTRARELYEQAADQGEIEALYYLAIMYRDGDGISSDLKRAQELFEKFLRAVRAAAASGDSAACLRLGKLLQYGDGVLQNEAEAVKWIAKAALLDLPDAQFHLSRLYAFGWCGLEQDSSTADVWLSKAVEAGHPEALYTKGIEQANLFLSSRDRLTLVAAQKWLELAAQAGYIEAKSVLRQLGRL